jgi:hypothetical protein
MAYPTPTAAINLIYSRLRAHVGLTGVGIYNDEEADTATEGIITYVASPGTNYGFVDGKREHIDPLIGVMCFGPDIGVCETRSAIVASIVEGLFGETDYGFVVRLAQERPLHDTTRMPNKGVRHTVGGLYRAHIIPSKPE